MTLPADIDIGRIIITALIAATAPTALGFLCRSAQLDSETGFAGRCVNYPKAFKIFVWVGWIFTVAIAIIAAFTARGDDFWPATLCVLLFVGLVSPLHLEAYFVRIIWNDETIHTHSPWRRSRRIPISSVTRCDFSRSMQWYRIHTKGYGMVRLPMFARGIPQLLEALPVPNPGYPPNPKHKGE
jgi:hypothetical protein